LSLWLDSNADGISTSDEMQDLQAAGIHQLEIIPKSHGGSDSSGNHIPLWAWASSHNLACRNTDININNHDY
jgi:hypothetical protein